jgi:hypothetical protein
MPSSDYRSRISLSWAGKSRKLSPEQRHVQADRRWDRVSAGKDATEGWFKAGISRWRQCPVRRRTISFSPVQSQLDEVFGLPPWRAQVHPGLPEIRKPFGLNQVRRQRRYDVAVSPLARIPDRFSQHGVKLGLAEFLRLPPYCLPRHLLRHRAGTGGQQRRPSLRDRPYLGFCCWRLVTALQAQTS